MWDNEEPGPGEVEHLTDAPDETLEPPDAHEGDPADALGAELTPEPAAKDAEIYTLVRYDVSAEQIGNMAKEFAPLAAPEADYDQRRKAIATCRELRVGVETTRVRLKRSALEYGRKVDAEAKRYTALLEAIEEPLKLTKGAIDEEKDRIKREKAEAEKRALEEKVRAEREAEEARLRAEREAEEARLAEERKALEAEKAKLEADRKAEAAARAERERVEAEQKAERERADAEKLAARQRELDAEGERLRQEREANAEKAKRELEAIEEQKRAVEAEKRRLEHEEQRRQARIKAEQEAKERAERERVEAEEQARRDAERKAEHEARMAALRPDVDKVKAFAAEIRSLATPVVRSTEASMALEEAARELGRVATVLEGFGSESSEAAE